MKKKSFYSVLVIFFALFFSCSSNSENSSDTPEEEPLATETTPVEEPLEIEKSPAVCIWDKVSVREAPSKKGKWITSLSIGESLTYLGIDSVVGKNTYVKVLLNDGNEGWAREDFIVNNAKPAVVLGDIDLYSRPDLLTKTGKKFSMMDIVSSIEKQDDWMQIKGKRTNGKWIENGWVKAQHISFESVDIATAKFAKQALEIEDPHKKVEAIDEIINNPSLSKSQFILNLETLVTELNASKQEVINEQQETDSIN